MPLEKGKSNKVIGKNIAELEKSYKKTGKLGNSHPKSKEKAEKQAAAIAYSEADRTKKESVMPRFEQLVEAYGYDERYSHHPVSNNGVRQIIDLLAECDAQQWEDLISWMASNYTVAAEELTNMDARAIARHLSAAADLLRQRTGN